ncbi:cyanophycinase [Aquabacter spiritensis]|uniref:Cyanophycinase n=1 Tax=Aquabacter spiritensis TaxID=933073 RepID=A0A4R3M1F2_9HYPH|nr:cyanophycinase [Aquabacter spiritensis]TCT06822.1 cyanophycinase [Aquabacter spiritensis]
MSFYDWFSLRTSDEPMRRLAVIGGRLEDGNAAIFGEMHRLAQGRILVFPTASGEPEEVGVETVQVFRAYGFEAELSPVFGPGAAAAARDPANAAQVERLGSVYFTGGNQATIIESLAPGGIESPVLAAIRAANAAGGLIAGSSAGAAIMSKVMIVGGTSLDAMVNGVTDDPERPGMLLGEGLDFFPYGIVDQHFIKRGRLGRLIVAMARSGVQRGFGIDENTALFVDGRRGRVIGEYGAFVLDMSQAVFDARGRTFEDIRLSYLDTGDEIDFGRMRVTAGPGKRRVRLAEIAYRAPARSQRNVFAAYTLYDLLGRLVLGDPIVYSVDRASAVEMKTAMAVTVELERVRGETRSLVALTENGFRMTALNFRCTVMSEKLSAARLANRATMLQRDYGMKPGPASRLLLLGSSPLQGGSGIMAEMLRHCEGDVGIIAAASSEPRETAAAHIDALRAHGRTGIDLGITIDNVENCGRDKALVERIAGMKTLFLPGGNQVRLVETLLFRGEETPILLAIARAHANGATLIGASGSASALSRFMIAGGSSHEAFRFGVSTDAGHHGLVIQEGVGFFGGGIVDQNLFSSRRLGRLIVACAEEGVRYGFGICEETMMNARGDGSLIDVFGRHGVVLVELDPHNLELQSDSFVARGVKLSFARPGDQIDVAAGQVLRHTPAEPATAALLRLVNELVKECGAMPLGTAPTELQRNKAMVMGITALGEGTVSLDIDSPRDDRT